MTARVVQSLSPAFPLQEDGNDFILMHFKQKNESVSWQIKNPVYLQPSVSAGALSRRAREEVTYIITQTAIWCNQLNMYVENV